MVMATTVQAREAEWHLPACSPAFRPHLKQNIFSVTSVRVCLRNYGPGVPSLKAAGNKHSDNQYKG